MQLQNILYFLIWAGLFFIMMRFGRHGVSLEEVLAVIRDGLTSSA